MKKQLIATLAFLTALNSANVVFAEEPLSASVSVTISDQGTLAVVQEQVTVTDFDGDNALTVSDALYAVHEVCYAGGAAAGYQAFEGEYGLSLGMLWGNDSGNFGYCVNNASCWSLADAVSEGDFVTAYIYADSTYYSDLYTFFDQNTLSAAAGETLTLTLSGAGYDADWNPVTVPVAGAELTVNGEKTGILTDEEGKAQLQITDGGSYVISAVSETQTLVPPVCKANLSAAETTPTESETEEATTAPDYTAASEAETAATDSTAVPKTGDSSGLLMLMTGLCLCAAVSSRKVHEN